MKPKRTKHNYTSELELKCLLIRIKNRNLDVGVESLQRNIRINKYILWFNKINAAKYPQEDIQRKNIIKYRFKDNAIKLAEQTKIDDESYEQFGNIILLMISKILTKPNFSGYTYKDEMYSDAIHKILKYLHNFDHTMISEHSGQLVNSFAYISQIIHNSVIYIINTKKKEMNNIKNQVSMEIVNHSLNIVDYNKFNSSSEISSEEYDNNRIVHEVVLEYLPNGLIQELEIVCEDAEEFDKVVVYIPKDYKINLDEYDKLKIFLKSNINILRLDPIEDDDGDADD
jgi:hypothetical protein